MTISVPDKLVYSSDGDGVTSQFSYPVRILEAGELVVLRRENDVDTTLTLNTDYTLSGIGDAGGVTITMLSVPIAGQKIVRYRATAPKQIVDLKDKQTNPAEAAEQQLDRLAMVGQDHDQRISEYEDRIDDLDTSVAAAAASATAAATSETNAASSDADAEAAADRAEAAAASIDYLTVADRTALKAVDTTKHTVVYFDGSNWEQVAYADVSALVTADAVEGVYARSTKDVTKVWARQFDGLVDVSWFCDASGDDTSAFSIAAAVAPAKVDIQESMTAIARAPMAAATVPPGDYTLTGYVDVAGKAMTWIMLPGSHITGGDFLNGRVVRHGGARTNVKVPFGTVDYAGGSSVRLGFGNDTGPGIVGIDQPSKLGWYADRDIVAGYFGTQGIPTLATISTGTTFTTTSVAFATPLSADVVRQLRIGMIIEAQGGSPAGRYAAFITNWATDGLSITTSGWYLVDGNQGNPITTPPDGKPVNINPITKIWGLNVVVQQPSDTFAIGSSGIEIDVLNNKVAIGSADADTTMKDWGVDVAAIGTYRSATGYLARNDFFEGFSSRGPTIGFLTRTGASVGRDVNSVGFSHEGTGVTAFRAMNSGGIPTFQVPANGEGILLGPVDTAQTVHIDFHSGGAGAAYDARIASVGGSATLGQGAVTSTASIWQMAHHLRPATDNSYTLGQASFRWSTIYAATGTINTSDATAKQDIAPVDKRVLAAWSKVRAKAFRFIDAVEAKGDEARIHIGYVAQDVVAAFESEGLDPWRYAPICKDLIVTRKTVKKVVERQAVELVDFERTIVEVVDGKAIRRTVTKQEERPAYDYLPMVDESGEPIMEDAPELDENGEPILVKIGERVVVKKTRQQVTHPVPRMETVEVDVEEEVEDGERLGLRYDQCLVLECAYLRSLITQAGG